MTGRQHAGRCFAGPTRIYVRSILKLIAKYRTKRVVHAMAHITGNGLPGNIPRILPPDYNAVLKKSSWPRPKIFNFLQRPVRSRKRRCSASSIWASAMW